MEAIIVSPAPGPKAFKPKSNTENQSGSESKFAPTLDKAINDKKSPSTSPSEHSHSAYTSKAHKEAQDDTSILDLCEDEALQAQATQSLNAETEPVLKVTEQGNSIAAAREATAMLVDGEDKIGFDQKGVQNSIARQSISSAFVGNHDQDDIELPKNTKPQIDSGSVARAITKSPNEAVVTAQFTQPLSNSPGIAEEQIITDFSQKSNNTVSLQNNDSISWNQTKSDTADMLMKNTTPLQYASEDTPVNNSSAIRVERFTAPPEFLSQNTNESPEETTPLSVERIAAKLVDMPSQPNHATTSLRENKPSLRQDASEQFIDAKLEHIDKKQHTQADQQSLNSDSDSAQKNSFSATQKTIDKTNETSFSQSLHTVSTEKPTSSGIDTLRPGGSVFTPQVQESNILHQVLHRFRISQHLQDSRLVMKLHPAELGDLKIDVQLKDGTINAHILAQTQQVQDILEKNMPRLKALMEEQGLMVNEITINLDTDVSDNKNMFDDHLARDEKSFATHKNIESAAKFELEQENIGEVEFDIQATPSGVNVMI